MITLSSKTGWTLACIYLAACAYFIATQGLFGESFIALILGLPWSMLPVFFEYGHTGGILLYALLLGPIALNAALLYWIGSLLAKRR